MPGWAGGEWAVWLQTSSSLSGSGASPGPVTTHELKYTHMQALWLMCTHVHANAHALTQYLNTHTYRHTPPHTPTLVHAYAHRHARTCAHSHTCHTCSGPCSHTRTHARTPRPNSCRPRVLAPCHRSSPSLRQTQSFPPTALSPAWSECSVSSQQACSPWFY